MGWSCRMRSWTACARRTGTVIEVRGVVKKTALMIVALIALTVFTMGVGTAIVAAGCNAAVAGLAQGAIYATGRC